MSKFNEVLRLRRLPPRGPQQQQGEQQGAAQQDPPASQESDGQQPSTSAEGGPTPEEAARDAAGKRYLMLPTGLQARYMEKSLL